VEIAELPEKIRGFGHVKTASAEQARGQLDRLWALFDDPELHRGVA
jgi:hypothetical protein